MTPYYTDHAVQLYHGDALDVLRLAQQVLPLFDG